jgi:hypothetical protein
MKGMVGRLFPLDLTPRSGIFSEHYSVSQNKHIGAIYMKLFWVTTEDHGEDWFVIATNAEEASNFHEEQEGYNPGDAAAEVILEIPDVTAVDIGWPSNEVLQLCGGKFLVGGSARIVEIGGRRFCEGLMESTIRTVSDDAAEAHGRGRPNNTERMSEH